MKKILKDSNIVKKKVSKKNVVKKNFNKKNNSVVKDSSREKKVVVKKNNIVGKDIVDDKKAFLVIGLLVLIVVVLFYFLFFHSPYKYSFVVDSIPYHSNYYTPTEFFNIISSEKTVFVSPVFEENNINPSVFNAMQLWNVILNASGVQTVLLVRVSENNVLSYCRTNSGLVEVDEIISLEECNNIISSDKWVVLLEQGSERVVIEENKAIIFSSIENSSFVSYSVIKQIFPNAESVFDMINQKIYGIQ